MREAGNGRHDKVGAVLVVGAGIGGIQAALDLAAVGLKVYLVEREPAIGGVMAQLDKIFPTNDCAMCVVSPKLVEAGRHRNIEVLTCAELEGLEGEAGHFVARVRKGPRYVVADECTGCGDCATVCPVARPDLFNAGLSQRRAAYKRYPQAMPNAYAIEKRGRAPCRDACPIHQRVQGTLDLVREGRFADAYRAIREDNPFPSVCGRVCDAPCEAACPRSKLDAPVNIQGLMRFVVDWAWEQQIPNPKLQTPHSPLTLHASRFTQALPPKRVAIIGAGPAGLTCAQDLALAGHAVTVFEALPAAGGMLRMGILAQRLSHELVEREIQDILDLGVELRLSQRVDDAAALLRHGADGEQPYDAVFATADAETLGMPVPGLFAGSEAVTGTTSVVESIAAGHGVARSIGAYLQGLAMPAAEAPVVADLTEQEVRSKVLAGGASAAPRQEAARLHATERVQTPETNGRLSEEQARAEAARCLSCGICGECMQCVYACEKQCIDLEMCEETVELPVGAVVLVPGFEVMPGDVRPELGYRRCPNVVTSIELERMLSPTGPWGGEVRRPSDGQRPHKLAFIQCVGSRDPACGHDYCSAICCMFTAEEAVIAREHDPHVEATVFTMDVRACGKGFERYIERAEHEHGVRFLRSMVSTVTEVPGSGNLRVRYATPDGRNIEDVFDLVVLAVGLRPPQGTRELAQRLGVALNKHGFAEPPAFEPGRTADPDSALIEGIYVAGAFSEPKDITETVIDGSCAAAQASAFLAEARGTQTEERVWPTERDVSEDLPRVGVFICHCGINIGAVVDVPAVVEYASGLPGVAYAERNLYTCSQDTQGRMRERIREHALNRVVVASCTPRTHEPLFQETIREAGLNPHLFELVNIREHVSWVHKGDRSSATEKAEELVRMAVAKACRLHSIASTTFAVEPSALVIGGGLAGMTAAHSIAEQGFGVTLVEREATLGGNLRHISTALPGEPFAQRAQDGTAACGPDPQALLQRSIEAVSANPRVRVLTGAELAEVSGYVGQYRTMVRLADGQCEEVQHGAIVVATGARQHNPQEYLYGEHPGVVTQRELEALLRPTLPATAPGMAALPSELTSVVMIQCVGSRDAEHRYCSRICCTEAIKNALLLKALDPAIEVTILFRDIRTFGFKERYYHEARRRGVVFLEYDEQQKPTVRVENGRLAVDVAVQPENEHYSLPADLLVLSTGIEPDPGNAALAELLKVPLTEDRFFMEAHVKLRPLDFAADGVYICGLAHSPRFLDETIAQARGAAVRAVGLLSKRQLEATPIVAHVNPRLCAACGLCVEVCPYGARVLEAEEPAGRVSARVIDVLCQGCGACVVACPNKASQQKGFEMAQVVSILDALRVEV